MMAPGKENLVRFFQDSGKINAAGIIEIARHFTEKETDKNEYFLKEGRISNEYLLLEKGFMRAYSSDINGNEITTAFHNANYPVFEVASFFNRIPSKENIQALAPCKGWVITYDKLNMLFHALPEFRDFGRAILVKGFAALKLRMLSLITETAEQRYAALLQSNPEIFEHAPLKYIASYLGITDTSLSRIRKERMRH